MTRKIGTRLDNVQKQIVLFLKQIQLYNFR